jgi:hypothetical protein
MGDSASFWPVNTLQTLDIAGAAVENTVLLIIILKGLTRYKAPFGPKTVNPARIIKGASSMGCSRVALSMIAKK